MRLALGILWIGLGLLYSQVLFFEPLNYDDSLYLSNHPAAELSLGSFLFWKTLFLSASVNLWHPLTDLSHQILFRIHAEPAIHHIGNVLLHGLSASVWLLLFKRITGRVDFALAATLLFAWHPITVESVAWISGRKDLLCTFFLSLSVLSYQQAASKKGKIISWRLILTAVAALLSKPIAFTLPLLLLAFDYWPLQRSEKFITLIKEKWLLFVLSCVSVLLTLYFQSQGTQVVDDIRSPLIRITEATWSLQKSLSSVFWPRNLHFIYSNPEEIRAVWIVMSFLIGFLILSFLLWKRKFLPFFISGVLWYLFTLGPTLGLIRAGNNLAADRYSYLPLLGLLIGLVGLLAKIKSIQKFTKISLVTLFVLAALFLPLSYQQISYWRNAEVLFSRVLKHEPRNLISHVELASYANKKGDLEIASEHLKHALEIAPESPGAHLILGGFAFEKANYAVAYEHYLVASKRRSREAWIYERLAACAHGTGDLVKTREYLLAAFQWARPQDHFLNLGEKWQLLFPNEPIPESRINLSLTSSRF